MSRLKTPSLPDPNLSTTVLVVGAGKEPEISVGISFTGLALAQGLKKYENLDTPSRDWNMGLHWGVGPSKGLLPGQLWARIPSIQVDPYTLPEEKDALPFVNSQSREAMASIPVPFFYRLLRRKLRGLMEQSLDIQYGKAIDSIEYSTSGGYAKAVFEDGSSLWARLIVGDDGARSKTRLSLLGPTIGQPRQLPYFATFVQARYSPDRARFLRQFYPLHLAGIYPAGHVSLFGVHDAADRDRPEAWTFVFYISWHSSVEEQRETAGWTNGQRLQQVKEFSKTFSEPWKSAFAWLPDDHPVWYMGLTDFDPRAEGHRWENHNGQVRLAGDAAHIMIYQRGQGLNHSVTDAANLVEAVRRFVSGTSTQADAISDYDTEMIDRAGGETNLSTVNTEMLHDWQKVLQSPLFTSGTTRRGRG
ncbi:FAD binding domain-containing protein [Aspergillus heteromorphus CBS 117.55]|uniref:FAD binding domain-containing protein n=1 Tax=Aspergillus heteromorphus CBS 117.55 TaxID=1448321 RepID=A0A317X2E1_9EURO|nr:FAD binding domain-containing protein [Aspergillus heteromorphus CBS 117.55]PWY90710.1 FAD binding domain-containing protein [Aspergillus heteromorphus CBS 117.55]